jgi:hypothetical protein
LVSVGVSLACLAFLVQAGVIIALYAVVGKMQKKMAPVLDRANEIGKAATPVISKAEAAIDRAGPVLDQARGVLAKAQTIIEETHPRITEISNEAVAIAKSGRRQVERVGELLDDAGSRAKERLDQIDRSVDHTVENLEQAGDVMKRAVLRPVHEVHGFAAGISAAVSSFARGKRRPSVDHATQDEEMFI